MSLPAQGGSVLRGCDNTCQLNECPDSDSGYPATVSPFELDAFEVTVGRFRVFVGQYPDSLPALHSGANPHNPLDDGWQDSWTSQLPATQDDLIQQISSSNCTGSTWSSDPTQTDDHTNLPMNCVSWYLAQAFCIWDAGRLPTEAEWDYVAAGGEEQRTYPWSASASDVNIDPGFANYYDSGQGVPVPVGSYPAGKGKWGQFDLAGNVAEWVWDASQLCYPVSGACVDCGITDGYDQKTQKGGSFYDTEDLLTVVNRGGDTATNATQWVGLRCARDF
ncbi:MAG TPA: SUMF1/EgtB/PvdO family nonheme iron enzyme [Polyangiaceae bacterium]|nr:SUMF1/EgtB/PvdO family nonheme iron enzyme [Polyangiaceae bacterium]